MTTSGSRRAERQEAQDLADLLRRQLAAFEAGDLRAGPAMRHRLEGAIVAAEFLGSPTTVDVLDRLVTGQ